MKQQILQLDRSRPWSKKYDLLVFCSAPAPLGPGPFGPAPKSRAIWAQAHLGPGPFGPRAHLGPGPFGPGPIWAQAHLGQGPFGPRPVWAQACLARDHFPFGTNSEIVRIACLCLSLCLALSLYLCQLPMKAHRGLAWAGRVQGPWALGLGGPCANGLPKTGSPA